MDKNQFIINIPNAESVNLESLVEYKSDQLVSLSLAQTPNFSIILFAIDQGAHGDVGKPHSAPGDALLQILDGEAEVSIGDKAFTTKKGESVVMPANVPHALIAKERFKMLMTYLRW